VPVGDEIAAARQLWSQMTAEERLVMGRLSAEFVVLWETGTDNRVLVAPASTMDQLGLPTPGPRR